MLSYINFSPCRHQFAFLFYINMLHITLLLDYQLSIKYWSISSPIFAHNCHRMTFLKGGYKWSYHRWFWAIIEQAAKSTLFSFKSSTAPATHFLRRFILHIITLSIDYTRTSFTSCTLHARVWTWLCLDVKFLFWLSIFVLVLYVQLPGKKYVDIETYRSSKRMYIVQYLHSIYNQNFCQHCL